VPGTTDGANRVRLNPAGPRGGAKPSIRHAPAQESRSRGRSFDIALSALCRLRAFSWLAPERLEELAGGMTLLRFERQQLIVPDKGMPPTDIYVVLSGATRAGLINRRGKRVTIEIEEPGHVFGGLSLEPSPEPRYFIEALSGTVLGRVSGSHFLKVTQPGNPENFGHVMRLMVRGMWQAFDRHVNFAGARTRVRLIEQLLELGGKFAARDKRGIILNVRVTRQDLADLIGASRQLVSALLNDLEARGALQRERHRLILHESRLREILAAGSSRHGVTPSRRPRA